MAITYRRDRDRGARGRRRHALANARVSSGPIDVTRDEALRGIAAAVSGRTDLATLFDDVIAYTVTFFSVERAGLWLIDDGPHPFRLAAHRGLSPGLRESVSNLSMDSGATGVAVARDGKLRVLQDAGDSASAGEMREAYKRDGIHTVCFVPIVFRERMLGLLVLYHETRREWPDEELELASGVRRPDGDRHRERPAVRGDRRPGGPPARHPGPGRRLNRIQDVRGIAEAIVTGRAALIDHDTIRVYRVDHTTGMCEPIAFQGVFWASADPGRRAPAGPGRRGPDRLGGRAQRAVLLGDADADPRQPAVGGRRRTGIDARRADELTRTRSTASIVLGPGRTASGPTTRRP